MKLASLATGLLLSTPALAQLGQEQPFNDVVTWLGEVIAVDVDADGDPDTLTIDRSFRRLCWFETLGGGEFSRRKVIIESAEAMTLPNAVDLDLDGQLDLVLASGGVPGWFRNVGGGYASFAPLLPGTTGATDVHALDLDGDGIVDLLTTVLSPSAKIQWSRGLGGTSFAATVDLHATSGAIEDLLHSDIDADGDIDLLYYALPSHTFVCLRNDGALPLVQEVLVPGNPQTSTPYPQLGDVDGDGLPELVFWDNDSPFPSSYESISWNQGGLSFGAPVRLAGDPAPRQRDFVDLDNDGDLDLIGWGYDAPRAWLRENTAGSLAARVDLPETTSAIYSCAFADLEGDGFPDLVKLPLDSKPAAWLSNAPVGMGERFLGTAELTYAIRAPRSMAAADYDLDGDVDHAVFDLVEDAVILARNDGTGAVQYETVIGGIASLPTSDQGPVLFPGDFDNDGIPDLAFRGRDRRVYVSRGLGDGSFAAPARFGWEPSFICNRLAPPADVDGDGDSDLLMMGPLASSSMRSLVWSESDGAGGFAPPVMLWETNQYISHAAVEDLDRDGRADIVAVSPGLADLNVLFGMPGGGFGAPQSISPLGGTVSFDLGDLDGDGDLDLARASFNPDSVVVYELQGQSFVERAALSFPHSVGTTLMIDVDADGDKDLAVGAEGPLPLDFVLAVYGQTSPFQFGPATIVDAQFPAMTAMAAVDHDLDGDEDLLWSSYRESSTGVTLNDSLGPVGMGFCTDAVNNSTGVAGVARASGSQSVNANALTLSARRLPVHTFGLFVGSQTQGSVFPVPNSIGRLCLSGSITRFSRPGQIGDSGPSGQFFLSVDLTNIPGPTGPLVAAPGETWHFQAWHRDVAGGVPTSNFTGAVSVMFQ